VIVTKFYKGQGLGNQLWVYAVLRAIAWNHNYSFGVESFKNYKLPNYIPLDRGECVLGVPHERPYGLRVLGVSKVEFEIQKVIFEPEIAISNWEERIANLSDGTKIEGYFQSINYIKEFHQEFQKIFRCNAEVPTDSSTCYISVRGGDYLGKPEICCDEFFYRRAIKEMQECGFNNFEIVTDDAAYANDLLPDFPVAHLNQDSLMNLNDRRQKEAKIAYDFALLQTAPALIISNSTFAWWAAWTNRFNPIVIGPRYWSHPRNRYQIWAPKEVAVESWRYSDGKTLISGSEAIMESGEMSTELQFYSRINKSKFDFNIRIRNFLYKNASRIYVQLRKTLRSRKL
jgi:hypothetical protein